ncbi:MAG: hypothetical protein ACXVZ4_13590 [Gaiellaceae bacterium]
MKPPVPIGVLRKLLKELEASARDEKPLAVGGAKELAAVLRKELGRGAVPGAVRGSDEPEGAAVLVYVLGNEPSAEDERALKRARRARVPIVAVAAGRAGEDVSIPYVLATDVVRVSAGKGFPHDAIARAIAGRLGEEGAPLAARLPLLRGAVCERLVASFARKNGNVAAAVFVPRADLPVLARNQVRMLLRLDQAYGLELDPRSRAPEVVAVLAAGLGLRTVARELLDLVPVAGWAVKGAVAYAGTRALGEAAIRRLEIGMPGRQGSSRPD